MLCVPGMLRLTARGNADVWYIMARPGCYGGAFASVRSVRYGMLLLVYVVRARIKIARSTTTQAIGSIMARRVLRVRE